ncbi:heme ABC transporter ATP-binding protein [Halobacteriales archaeon QS_1_68_20]|nr:MAG: heme ABC transporter ATP-binding protein [Halobacteriales archaeon QS_1_68_20]
MTDPIVEVRGVSVDLGGVEVLSDVDLTVESGRFVGLIGPNGAGKTTLLRTINGVLAPDDGAVRVDGQHVTALSASAVGRRVATVPQNTNLSFSFDVRQVVAMGRNPYVSRFGTESVRDRELVERALERTDVAELADRPITDVSGGERQRVLLARALAQDASVLMLDEPTASLDVNHQVRTLELVADLVSEGRTAVAAIHDLNLAAHYCDELVLLSDGRVLDAGDPEDVLTEENLQTAFDARAAVTSHPVTGSTYVTALPERDGDHETRVHVVAGGGTGSRLLYLLDAAGYDVSAGALSEGDADLRAALQLGLDVVETPPYAPVDDAAEREVRERVREAAVTVVADVEVGPGNLPNLRAASEADRLVLVEQRPFTERNYAGDDGWQAYEPLREHGRVVDPDDVVGAVESVLAGDPPQVTDAVADVEDG